MPIVRLEGSGESLEVGKGANLRKSLQFDDKTPHSGVWTKVNCMGLGLCGSCWVIVVDGAENLSPPSKMEELNWRRPLSHGWRLACQARVYGDVVIKLQDGS